MKKGKLKMSEQDAFKYRIIILEPVNNENNTELLDSVRSIATYLSKNPQEIYIENLQPPVLKEIKGVAKKEQMYVGVFSYGNGFYTNLNNPDYILLVDINNKWEEVTKSNFNRINKIILDK